MDHHNTHTTEAHSSLSATLEIAVSCAACMQGTGFQDILIHKFQLSSQRQWDVATVMPLK
jgi:hypothetical protein